MDHGFIDDGSSLRKA